MDRDREFAETCRDLRISETSLDRWLKADLLRAIDDRRFHFHTRRGRKRIWSPEAFKNLKAAIERESAAGGVLAGCKRSSAPAAGMPTVSYDSTVARTAFEKVSTWLPPSSTRTQPSKPREISKARSATAPREKSAEVIRFQSRH